MNRAQEIILLGAFGAIAVMVIIPPWNGTRYKGDILEKPLAEKSPVVYRSIFLTPPQIHSNSREYIPQVYLKRLGLQCGLAVILAGCMMLVVRDKKEQDEWPPKNSKNQPWNAGQ